MFRTTFPNADTVRRIKMNFPSGTRVVLGHMSDPYVVMPAGIKGTVEDVDDAGTIHVRWDNGRKLGVVYGEDACRKEVEA